MRFDGGQSDPAVGNLHLDAALELRHHRRAFAESFQSEVGAETCGESAANVGVPEVVIVASSHIGLPARESCTFRIFTVLKKVLLLTPNMEISSLTGSPCW